MLNFKNYLENISTSEEKLQLDSERRKLTNNQTSLNLASKLIKDYISSRDKLAAIDEKINSGVAFSADDIKKLNILKNYFLAEKNELSSSFYLDPDLFEDLPGFDDDSKEYIMSVISDGKIFNDANIDSITAIVNLAKKANNDKLQTNSQKLKTLTSLAKSKKTISGEEVPNYDRDAIIAANKAREESIARGAALRKLREKEDADFAKGLDKRIEALKQNIEIMRNPAAAAKARDAAKLAEAKKKDPSLKIYKVDNQTIEDMMKESRAKREASKADNHAKREADRLANLKRWDDLTPEQQAEKIADEKIAFNRRIAGKRRAKGISEEKISELTSAYFEILKELK